jgi:hypothetical protein
MKMRTLVGYSFEKREFFFNEGPPVSVPENLMVTTDPVCHLQDPPKTECTGGWSIYCDIPGYGRIGWRVQLGETIVRVEDVIYRLERQRKEHLAV